MSYWKTGAAVLILIACGGAGAAEPAHGHDEAKPGEEHFFHKRFDDPNEFSKRFDAPERDEWQKPEKVIESLKLSPDAKVAEVGASTGYFAVRLAKHLKKGKVIGIDVEPAMVAYLNKRAKKLGLANVDARLAKMGDRVDLKEKVDLVLCVDTYHHIPDRVSYFANYIKFLKSGGRLAIIDWTASSPKGPPPEHRIPPEKVKEEMKKAGFVSVQEIDYLPNQFFIVFEPTTSTR